MTAWLGGGYIGRRGRGCWGSDKLKDGRLDRPREKKCVQTGETPVLLQRSMMEFPQLTALQFVVVHLLFSGPKGPGEVRKGLRELGLAQSASSFSRLIGRLQCGDCVEAVYEEPVRGNALGGCRLAVTDMGVAAWKATREFYASRSGPPPELTPVATEAGKLAHYPRRTREKILARRDEKEIREALERLARSWMGGGI